jgi:hypothetical protein
VVNAFTNPLRNPNFSSSGGTEGLLVFVTLHYSDFGLKPTFCQVYEHQMLLLLNRMGFPSSASYLKTDRRQ